MESNFTTVEQFPKYLFGSDLVGKIPDQRPLLLKNHLQDTIAVNSWQCNKSSKPYLDRDVQPIKEKSDEPWYTNSKQLPASLLYDIRPIDLFLQSDENPDFTYSVTPVGSQPTQVQDKDQCFGTINGSQLAILVSPSQTLSESDKSLLTACKTISDLTSLPFSFKYCELVSSDLLYIPRQWTLFLYNFCPSINVISSIKRNLSNLTSKQNTLAPLPEDTFAYILTFLPIEQLPNVSLVSKYFYAASSHDYLWRFHLERNYWSPKAQDLEPFGLSYKDKYKGLIRAMRNMYKLPVPEAVQKAVSGGFIADEPRSIAKFLLQGQNFKINKTEIGNFLTQRQVRKWENMVVAREYTQLMDFSGVHFYWALRTFLTTLRLPGETSRIDAIMGIFATAYVDQNPDCGMSKDGAYLLVYSLIMLNTDLHSFQIKNKMNIANWQRNLQACNNGQNFPEEFLTELYTLVSKYAAVQFDFMASYEGEVKLKQKFLWMEDWKTMYGKVANKRFQCYQKDSDKLVVDLDLDKCRFTGDLTLIFEENDKKYEFMVDHMGQWKCALYTNALPEGIVEQAKRILRHAYSV